MSLMLKEVLGHDFNHPINLRQWLTWKSAKLWVKGDGEHFYHHSLILRIARSGAQPPIPLFGLGLLPLHQTVRRTPNSRL